MFSLEKKWIIIQAYKHNEELHRQWSHSYVLQDNEDYFVLTSVRAAVVESDGRKWHTKEPALFILSKKHWFNVIAMLKENGICYYVNIASPAIFDNGYIKYIDYDLDVKLYEDGTTRLLDVSEYKKHADEQGYSEDIRNILQSSVDKVYKMINEKEFPFVDEEIQKLFKKFEEETNRR